jgi:hypothetical protein
VIQLVKVDVVSQRFEGTFLLGLRIEGGAISPDLSNVDDAVVNKRDDGSLHATAAWYLSRIDFPNAVSY